MNRCKQPVHWWDCDLNVRCLLHAGHTGPHADGCRWFDDYGLQVPYSPQLLRSNAGHYDISPREVSLV